jgi:hypothetical protein
MGLLEDFPEDPFAPSLSYAASRLLPVRVPWTNELIKLGTSLAVSKTEKSTFTDKIAFNDQSLASSGLIFTPGSSGSFRNISSTESASSSDHASLSLQGEIGGKGLSASGRGQFESRARSDRNVSILFKP